MIERTFCINLDRRPDRWEQFLERLPEGWPFPAVERWPAVDGRQVPAPAWWQAGAGAWGCYRSHQLLLEHCLAAGVESVLVLEDDAEPVGADFAARCRRFLESLPDDWGWAYLGGQMLQVAEHPPRRVNDLVATPWNVNRTHAYALRGRAMIARVYRHLCDVHDWEAGHHVDHHLGRIHRHGAGIYAPADGWLFGQAAGPSDIGNQTWRRVWDWTAIRDTNTPMVAVLGQFRGGTSCVAGVLHHLGVHMGKRFAPPKPSNPRGFFEASQLAQICRDSYREPRLEAGNTSAERVARLRAWGNARRDECQVGQLAGGKHPTLCLMVPEIAEAWGTVRWVAVERPVGESINSLLKRGWGWPPTVVREVLPRMIEVRDRDLERVPAGDVLRLRYRDLVSRPARTIDQVVDFLEIEPTAEQYAAAVQFVEPSLRTESSDEPCGQAAR